MYNKSLRSLEFYSRCEWYVDLYSLSFCLFICAGVLTFEGVLYASLDCKKQCIYLFYFLYYIKNGLSNFRNSVWNAFIYIYIRKISFFILHDYTCTYTRFICILIEKHSDNDFTVRIKFKSADLFGLNQHMHYKSFLCDAHKVET